jgi:hypothetical protein
MISKLNIKKYQYSFRLLVIITPDYENNKYIIAKKKFKKNKIDFHQKNTKLIVRKRKNVPFQILLIGFDGKIKHTYTSFSFTKIMKDINDMPMEQLKKKNKKHLSLFEDYHPNTTISGLGFKNSEKAIQSLQKIKQKPLSYQKAVINTLYYRAKYHPYQTEDMKEAMKIFKKWIDKHKVSKNKIIIKTGGNSNNNNDRNYLFLDHSIINYYKKLASYYKISKVARGLEKPKTTNKGFLQVYTSSIKKEDLKNIPVRKNNPSGADWYRTRINRIRAKLGQMKSQNIPFFHDEGKLKGLPTKMHTILIMWAYSPYTNKLKILMKKNKLNKI